MIESWILMDFHDETLPFARLRLHFTFIVYTLSLRINIFNKLIKHFQKIHYHNKKNFEKKAFIIIFVVHFYDSNINIQPTEIKKPNQILCVCVCRFHVTAAIGSCYVCISREKNRKGLVYQTIYMRFSFILTDFFCLFVDEMKFLWTSYWICYEEKERMGKVARVRVMNKICT